MPRAALALSLVTLTTLASAATVLPAAAAPTALPKNQQAAVFVVSRMSAPVGTGSVYRTGGITGGQTYLKGTPLVEGQDARGPMFAALRFAGGDVDEAAVAIDPATGAVGATILNAGAAALSGDAKTMYYVANPVGRQDAPNYVESVGVNGGARHRLATSPAGRGLEALAVSNDGSTAWTCAATPLLGGSQADFAKIKAPNLYRLDLRTHAFTQVRLVGSLGSVNCDSIVPSPDGKTLAIGMQTTQGDDPYLNLVDLATGRVRLVSRHYRGVTGWSADSRQVYAELSFPTSDSTLVLLNLATLHATPVPKVDGTYLAGVFPVRALA